MVRGILAGAFYEAVTVLFRDAGTARMLPSTRRRDKLKLLKQLPRSNRPGWARGKGANLTRFNPTAQLCPYFGARPLFISRVSCRPCVPAAGGVLRGAGAARMGGAAAAALLRQPHGAGRRRRGPRRHGTATSPFGNIFYRSRKAYVCASGNCSLGKFLKYRARFTRCASQLPTVIYTSLSPPPPPNPKTPLPQPPKTPPKPPKRPRPGQVACGRRCVASHGAAPCRPRLPRREPRCGLPRRRGRRRPELIAAPLPRRARGD